MRRNMKIQTIIKRKTSANGNRSKINADVELSYKHFEEPITNMLNNIKKMA